MSLQKRVACVHSHSRDSSLRRLQKGLKKNGRKKQVTNLLKLLPFQRRSKKNPHPLKKNQKRTNLLISPKSSFLMQPLARFLRQAPRNFKAQETLSKKRIQ